MAALVMMAGCGSRSKGSDAAASVNDYAYSEEMPAEYDSKGIANGAYTETEIEKPDIDPELTSEKLVYRGSLSIETKEYEKSREQLRQKISAFGGIISDESEYAGGRAYHEERSLWTLYMTVRIPTERYDEFMNGAGEIGNVISRSGSVVNISTQYYDVSAQIEALEKQEKRLLEMMDAAVTIEDMITVEDRLSEVQYQLNSLKTDRGRMDTDVAYSTVNISMTEVSLYTETSDTFWDRLAGRFTGGWHGFVNGLEEFVLAVVFALPYLILAGIVLFVIIRNRKKLPKISIRRKGKEKADSESA